MHEGHAPPSRQLHHRYRREAEGYRLAAAVALVLAMALPAPAATARSQDGGPWAISAGLGPTAAANGSPDRPALPLHYVLTRDKGAQEQNQDTTGAVSPQATAPSSAPEERPLYEAQMLRLAEVLGALSFLRSLCGASDAPQWYDKMRALIDAEASTPAERERLAGSYNRGFNGYALTYRHCNASAEAAIARFLDEGARLAATITSRFGG
ncbi:TIGR02301 family protein [Chelatococcus asaccharovorans]|uniref:TIGR02301 family protein n=1 Tax=Chelatococcus asaccharovorans TaxID=28210 RepID=UPI00224C773C|nr:TIGR02301 family protein [Chelatococcus asaccharovorans]CAH1669895.1 conserved hypothetical protein [Chelatococcus asaccharovorans]CAH1678641.1 conserved hypothetical protein [Chelatococcus asaccharovorans]